MTGALRLGVEFHSALPLGVESPEEASQRHDKDSRPVHNIRPRSVFLQELCCLSGLLLWSVFISRGVLRGSYVLRLDPTHAVNTPPPRRQVSRGLTSSCVDDIFIGSRLKFDFVAYEVLLIPPFPDGHSDLLTVAAAEG